MKMCRLLALLLPFILLSAAGCQTAPPPEPELATATTEVIAEVATATRPAATATTPPTSPPPDPATATTAPPTEAPTQAATLPPPPPLIVNGSQPQGTGSVSGTLTYGADFLLRIDARRNNQPEVPGAGIASVDFRVSSTEIAELYTHTEYNAAYCIFGGGEPDCNSWPLEAGVYRWGSGGPPIEPGRYFVEAIFHYTPDSDDGSGTTEDFWFFDFEIAP
jgi:hypothetical protein